MVWLHGPSDPCCLRTWAGEYPDDIRNGVDKPEYKERELWHGFGPGHYLFPNYVVTIPSSVASELPEMASNDNGTGPFICCHKATRQDDGWFDYNLPSDWPETIIKFGFDWRAKARFLPETCDAGAPPDEPCPSGFPGGIADIRMGYLGNGAAVSELWDNFHGGSGTPYPPLGSAAVASWSDAWYVQNANAIWLLLDGSHTDDLLNVFDGDGWDGSRQMTLTCRVAFGVEFPETVSSVTVEPFHG